MRPRCALEIDDASEVRIEKIYRRFEQFEKDLPVLCEELRLQRAELTFIDSASIITDWLRDNI
ncbi:MAG: hypothetical protein L0Y72_16710 [Gemmataceae bacterium]|nr:hypothetical protein [Gemmataceae bacterium]